MAYYVYFCPDCGAQKDKSHSIDRAPKVTCEECGKRMRRRLFAPGLRFKGEGFYATDYDNREWA